jgi:hypothetical protein
MHVDRLWLIPDLFWPPSHLLHLLLLDCVPIALFAMAYSLYFHRYKSLNLALAPSAFAASYIFLVALPPVSFNFESFAVAACLATTACLGTGALVEYACFSSWKHMPVTCPDSSDHG